MPGGEACAIALEPDAESSRANLSLCDGEDGSNGRLLEARLQHLEALAIALLGVVPQLSYGLMAMCYVLC